MNHDMHCYTRSFVPRSDLDAIAWWRQQNANFYVYFDLELFITVVYLVAIECHKHMIIVISRNS